MPWYVIVYYGMEYGTIQQDGKWNFEGRLSRVASRSFKIGWDSPRI